MSQEILREALLMILPLVTDEDNVTAGLSMAEIKRRLSDSGVALPTDKTIRRELLSLVDVVGSTGATRSTRWYTTLPRTKFQINNMNLNMAMAMCALRLVAKRNLPSVVLSDLEETFENAQHYLAAQHISPLGKSGYAWGRKTLRIDGSQPMRLPKVDPEVYRRVTEGLFYDKKLSFLNTPFGEKTPSSRPYVMSPLGIVDRAGVLYLVAWGLKRPGQRFLFRMDRMSNVKVLDEAADLDPSFDLMDYVNKEEALNFSPSENIQIEIFVSEPLREDKSRRRHPLREFWLAEDQSMEEQDDGFVLRATVKPSVMLWQLLHGHAASIEIISPAWVREQFREQARGLARLYE